jgi:hypothetical protein
MKPRCTVCGRVRWSAADDAFCPNQSGGAHRWSLEHGYRPRLIIKGPTWWLEVLWYEYLAFQCRDFLEDLVYAYHVIFAGLLRWARRPFGGRRVVNSDGTAETCRPFLQ